jgi:hypothetical protein
MRCEKCQAQIERYFDGELSGPAADLVAGHLAVCSSCAKSYRRLEREQNFYLRHEGDVEVSPAFWPSVFAKAARDRFEAAAARPGWNIQWLREYFNRGGGKIGALRFSPLSTAALVLFAIGVTAGVMKYVHLREEVSDRAAGFHQTGVGSSPSLKPPGGVAPTVTPGQVTDVAGGKVEQAGDPQVAHRTLRSSGPGGSDARQLNQQTFVPRRRQSPDDLVREAEQKYLAAIALLSRDASRRRSQLDPETLAQFDQTLAAVDRAIAGTRRAVRGRPDDPVAVQYMLAAYSKKVDVLRQMISNE